MFKKCLCTIFALTLSAALFSGCDSPSKTTVSSTGSSAVISYENIDLQLCANNTIDYFKNGNYGLDDITVEIPTSDNNFINIIAVTKDKPDDNSAYVSLLQECLTKFNDEVIKLAPDCKPSSEGYYGGIYDQYEVVITATCIEDMMKKWPVYQTISKGQHDPIVTNDDEFDLGMFE